LVRLQERFQAALRHRDAILESHEVVWVHVAECSPDDRGSGPVA
jgi:hypothetical protein